MKYDLDSFHVLTEANKGQFLNIGMNSVHLLFMAMYLNVRLKMLINIYLFLTSLI